MSDKLRIALAPGDGIGPEITRACMNIFQAAGVLDRVEFEEVEMGQSVFAKGETRGMTDEAVEAIEQHGILYKGPMGTPIGGGGKSINVTLRKTFGAFANLRHFQSLPGVETVFSRAGVPVDFYVVRENVEGEYSEIGGRLNEGTEDEVVMKETVFTRKGVDRVMRYAFDLAATREARHVTSATKSNGITHTMPYWDERFAAISSEYPDIRTDQFHIDILTANFVLHPDWFDVVVGSNLFGDILSDLGPAVAGTIGIAPGANINPPREFPSMFEPVHGSAPDIAGRGIANPIGQIWSGAMMLEHLGHPEAAKAMEEAIETVLAEPSLHTPDMGGKATTADLGGAIAEALG